MTRRRLVHAALLLVGAAATGLAAGFVAAILRPTDHDDRYRAARADDSAGGQAPPDTPDPARPAG